MIDPICQQCPHDRGGGDHDEAYRFGRTPSAEAPFPFTMRQFVRLWLVRLRLGDDRAELRARTGHEAAA